MLMIDGGESTDGLKPGPLPPQVPKHEDSQMIMKASIYRMPTMCQHALGASFGKSFVNSVLLFDTSCSG